MKYQLLATDLDGTLLNQKKELTSANKDMINRALDAGVTVVFSSGRCLEEMRDLIPCFPKMRYAICLSGGCVFDLKENRPLFETPYDRKILEAQYDFCREKDAMGMILTGRNLYLEERFYGHLDLVNMGHYSRSYEKYVTWVPDLSKIVYDRSIPIDKFNFYFRKEGEREECFRVFEAEGGRTAACRGRKHAGDSGCSGFCHRRLRPRRCGGSSAEVDFKELALTT